MKYPNRIGFLADLHCGSHQGILSPHNDPKYPLKPGQKYIYDCFMWLAENWPQLDLLVLNGDVIDGEQHKSKHAGLHTPMVGEQVDIAVQAVNAWCDVNQPTKIVRIDGTPYHEGYQGALKEFDARVGSEWVGDVFDLKFPDGVCLNVKHQPEGGAAMYKGTVVEREGLWTVIDEVINGAPKASHIVRAHLHFRYRVDTFGKTIVLMPCFQLQTAHARKGHYRRWQPSIGGVLMEKDDLAEGGYAVHIKTFDLPKRTAREYETVPSRAEATEKHTRTKGRAKKAKKRK